MSQLMISTQEIVYLMTEARGVDQSPCLRTTIHQPSTWEHPCYLILSASMEFALSLMMVNDAAAGNAVVDADVEVVEDTRRNTQGADWVEMVHVVAVAIDDDNEMDNHNQYL